MTADSRLRGLGARLPLLGGTLFGLLSVFGLLGRLPNSGSVLAWWFAAAVQFSLLLSATLISELLLGTALGWICAYGPRWLQALLERASELVGALPLFVYLIVLRLATGGEPFPAFVGVVCLCRMLLAAERTHVSLLRLEASVFAAASRGFGSSHRHRMAHHFFSHILSAGLSRTLHLPAFFLGLEACLGLVGTPSGWPSWGEALVDRQAPLFNAHRMLALASLVGTGAWAASSAASLSLRVKKRAPRVGVCSPASGG